ncbi:hypothetical protein [Mesorhizobium sp.]|uniref:hypothetical protein n=1 Tax=Mesorhizobium sp. TaxID=1871066 RepID=UPI00120CE716|nr:hypothetical protein [Mesorhizobium sp.]TIS49862.1 MAG: hypothetical protein E5W96_10825 [Mesorhizobium sp.]
MHMVSTRRRAGLAGVMATAAALESGSASAQSADRAWTYLSNALGHRGICQSGFLNLIRDSRPFNEGCQAYVEEQADDANRNSQSDDENDNENSDE